MTYTTERIAMATIQLHNRWCTPRLMLAVKTVAVAATVAFWIILIAHG